MLDHQKIKQASLMPLILGEKQPASLTLWTVVRKGGPIVHRLRVVTGPVRVGGTGLRVPPELLGRTSPLTDDQEDPACR